MSECGSPLCKICGHSHWSREPHILPANAPAEKRSNRAATTNGADTNCRTLRTDPRMPEGVPGTGRRGMNGQREVSRQGIVRPTLQNPPRRTPETPSAAAEKPATNTRREGRRVLKAEAARPDATRTAATAKPNPPTPPARSMAEEQTKADKVTPGKRKTAPKKKRKAKKKGQL